MRTWREAACFSPPAYVCVGRRVLIHKQSARSFIHSRQGSQAMTGTSGPNRVSDEADTGAVADSAIVSFLVCVGQRPTHPLILLGAPTLLQICRPAWQPNSCSSQGQCTWQTEPGAPDCQRSRAGRGPPGCSKCNGSFPS